MTRTIRHLILALLAGTTLLATQAAHAQAAKGKPIYDKVCVACHASGAAGAPKYGDAAAWAPRLKAGISALYTSALNGKGAMPKKGGATDLPDADVKAAVDYLVAAAGPKADDKKADAKDAAKDAKKDEKKPEDKAAAAKPADTKAADAKPADAKPADAKPAAAPAPVAAAPAAAAPVPPVGAADVNAFNRLLKPVGKRNLPPMEDGIHDPANDGTAALQPPLTAYTGLPKSNAGNRIDWVQSIGTNKINPRWDRNDPKAEPVVMDLNIVREVKGSMPDVVYPHKQHTQWLDCSNCHPAIFVPQKGANQISMAAILLGQKCGVCHGKVAFPVSECRNCHSKKKDLAAAAPAAAKAPEAK